MILVKSIKNSLHPNMGIIEKNIVISDYYCLSEGLIKLDEGDQK